MISLFFLVSTQSKESNVEKNTLFGIWIKKGGNYNSGYKYSKEEKFKKNNYGIQFNEDKSLIIRRPSSGCGMGKPYYMDFNGTWKFTSESTITISYQYFKDTKEKDFKIISISESKLVLMELDERTIFAE